MRGRYELHAPRSYLEDNPARLVWPGRRAQLIPAGAEVVTEYEDAIVAVLTPTPAGGTMIEATYRPGTFRPYLAALMEALRALPIPPDRPRAETTRLSARHQDILTRYLNGDAVKAIANDVHFAPQTVHNILTALRRQLGEERVPRRHKPSGGWSQVETG